MTSYVSRTIFAVLTLVLGIKVVGAAEPEPIVVERNIQAPIHSVWKAWATQEGAQTFFARGAIIEPRVDGEYSILFFPDNEAGQRGAEGMRILAFEPPSRLMFSWNAPPIYATKTQRAIVEVRLTSIGPERTHVQLKHYGFGSTKTWHHTRDYFAEAWPVVLDRLKHRFEKSVIDWDNLPDRLVYRPVTNR